MKQTFNYTERYNIAESDIKVFLRQNGTDTECKIDLTKEIQEDINLGQFDLILSIRSKSNNTGTIQKLNEIINSFDTWFPLLNFQIDQLENMEYKLQVVKDGRLVMLRGWSKAQCNTEDANGTSFLPIFEEDLGAHEVWKINFDDNIPVLVLNSRFHLRSRIMEQPYKSLILSKVVREILMYYTFVLEMDLEDPNDAYGRKWLNFIKGTTSETCESKDLESKYNFIDILCRNFENRSAIHSGFELFANQIGDDQ